MGAAIDFLQARQILDSRGNPTVEVDLYLTDGSLGRAAVPSGASTGAHEALEIRDGDQAYLGKSVDKVLNNINNEIFPYINQKSLTLSEMDQLLRDLDGTPNKSRLGANALLAISMAYAVASAISEHEPLYAYLGSQIGNRNFQLPRPLSNVMNGGAHANWSTDIQEYQLVPQMQESFSEQLRKVTEIYHVLGDLLSEGGYAVTVGDEGGYAPTFTSNNEPFEYMEWALEKSGYAQDFALGIDAAATEFYRDGQYQLQRDGRVFTTEEMLSWYEQLTQQHNLWSIEDPLHQDDWSGWQRLTERFGAKHQIIGDDFLVTNPERITQAIEQQACNAVLIKLNQIGTVTETLQAIKMTLDAGWEAIPSHRSGETEDVFLAHLTVGSGARQIKIGAPTRSERTAKYNELLRIEEQLNKKHTWQ